MSCCRLSRLLIPGLLLVLLVACQTPGPTVLPTEAVVATVPPVEVAPTAEEAATDVPPTAEPPTAEAATAEPTAAPPAEPEATAAAPQLPAGVAYDLGEAIVIQERFAGGTNFREMPVRLNGVMAVPDANYPQEGPYPVVLILHGTHPGCPVDEMGVDRWPCDPELEQPNFMGFEYLVRELAARGYVALSININAENTFGFGEPIGGERIAQIVDLHLSALAEAAAGGTNNFGVDLDGVADMQRLVFFGHSRGGEAASWLTSNSDFGPGLDSPYSYANRGYGPVRGLLLIAPAVAVFGADPPSVPLAVVISSCDGDVVGGDGQIFYEAARHKPDNVPATSVILAGANHNAFNTILGPDLMGNPDRPDCETLLDPEDQRRFLVDYAANFLTTLFSPDPDARLAANARMGLDVIEPAPSTVLGRPAIVSSLSPAADRQPLLVPSDEDELTTNSLGGPTVAEGLTLHYCEEGFITPSERPGSEPCRRVTITMPGNPAMAIVTWTEPGGELRFELPEGARDLSRFTTLSLRAAVDPLSELNTAGATQRFSVRLTDGAGGVAVLTTREDEPALAFPDGMAREDEFFGMLFTGLVPMTTIRLLLDEATAVDLTDIAEIALVFDQTASGNLFLGDVELVRPPQIVGASSTLLENAGGDHAKLTGVGRVLSATSCTGSFINPSGSPDAPAYLITNGHCAQEWDANRVFIDQPADGWSAVFNYFVDTAAAQVKMPVSRVAYSTMKGRDVAVLELEATAGELIAQGIQPLALADQLPETPFTMRVTGVPVTGVPPSLAYLREEYCLAAGRANLFEFIWHFDDTVANACRDIYGGSSGSPVFVGDDPAIIALMNTTNIGGVTPCALGTPCEARSGVDDVTLNVNTSYATPVAGLGACFGADGRFELSAAGCPLDDGRQLLLSGFPPQPIQATVSIEGVDMPAAWNTTVSGDLPYYRYKTGRAGDVDCRSEDGYGPVVALAEADTIVDPLPPEEGSSLLCVLGGANPTVDGTWQPVDRPTVARAEIDMTPPALTPAIHFASDGFGGFRFEPIFAPPELSHFEVLFGPAEETDCSDITSYMPYRRIPFNLPAEQLPARICVIGYDVAGNAGEPYSVVIGE